MTFYCSISTLLNKNVTIKWTEGVLTIEHKSKSDVSQLTRIRPPFVFYSFQDQQLVSLKIYFSYVRLREYWISREQICIQISKNKQHASKFLLLGETLSCKQVNVRHDWLVLLVFKIKNFQYQNMYTFRSVLLIRGFFFDTKIKSGVIVVG